MDRLRLYTNTVTGAGDQLELTGIGNTDLRPERSVEIEGGFNAQILDSRLTLDLTFYRKTQVDALMRVALPGSVNGGGSVVTNIGNIKNTGIEMTLSMAPIRMPQLRWSADLSFSSNRNRLVQLGQGVDPNPAMGLVEGYPVSSRWARPIVGIADDNGDGVLQPEEIQVGDSMVYMGRLYPNYQLTLYTNVELFNGALGLTAGFDHVAGQTQIDQTTENNWVLARPLVDPTAALTDQAAVLAVTRTNYGLIQTLSTFRFNSFSVTYRPPTWVARLFRAQTFNVHLQGGNLGLWTNYRGKDPNVSAWSPGETIVDTGQLPMPRTWQLSLDMSY